MGLWFERLYSSLRLPFWVGALVFGGIVFFALLVAGGLAVGLLDDVVAIGLIYFVPFATLACLLAQAAARSATRRIEQLKDYARTMGDGGKIDLDHLYSVRNAVLTSLALMAIIQPIYIVFGLPSTWPLEQRIIVSIPFFYWNVFLNTFVWVWMYTSYSVHKIGKLSFSPRPFAQDRALGLKPFGRFSLQLTGSYVALIAIIVLPNIAVGFSSLPLLILFASLFLLAPISFLLPLLPFRRTLLRTKRELQGRIGVRYTRVFELVDARADGRIDQSIINELTAVDKIQRDVQQIHTWPFDAGVVVRLSAIVLSVTAIILARIIQIVLRI